MPLSKICQSSLTLLYLYSILKFENLKNQAKKSPKSKNWGKCRLGFGFPCVFIYLAIELLIAIEIGFLNVENSQLTESDLF